MEEASLEVVLLVALVFSILAPALLLRLSKTQKKKKPPPGPRGLPLIGNLHVLGHIPFLSLYELSKVHGPLMRLRLGSQAVIVASTPAAARQILQAHDHAFSARPRLLVPTHLHNCADILFSSPADPHWRFLRQLCSSHLFSKKRLDAFRPLRNQEVRALLTSVLTSAGSPLNMRVELHKLASNIICRMALGKRLPELAMASQAQGGSDLHMSIINLTAEMNKLLGVFNIGDFFPSLAWLDIQGYGKQSKALALKFKPVLQAIIDERRSDRTAYGLSNNGAQDFLDLLLQAASDAQENSPITDDHVKAVIINMFGGGLDTSSLSIECALTELLANPSKMITLQEELEHVVGKNRLVEESDIPQLPYLQAVVKEAMRLHPVVPLLVPHLSTKACEVLGYDIPPNTIAYINAWAIGRDPNTWENPFKFVPERFLGKEIDVNGKYFELLPFGSGRRGCPGWMLGLVTVQIALASLVQGFNWKIIKDLDISKEYGLQLAKFSSPLIVQATPKLARTILSENS